MKISIFCSAILAILLTACSNNEPENGTDTITTAPSKEVQLNEFDQLMTDIDAAEESMPMAQSLLYTKEDHTMSDAMVHFDKNNAIAKITDYFMDGPTSSVTRSTFYYNGGTKFASKLIQQLKPEGGKEHFIEKITFYDKKGKATSTKERKADFEELLENESFNKSAITKMDETIALQKINKEGEYAITFQGFVDAGQYSFLIVGENKPNGYTSSLSIQSPLQNVNYLKSKGKAELGRPLVIDFERILDNQGYEMQLLMDLKLVEKSK